MSDAQPVFHLVLIKPSHYDDEGYVIQWARAIVPSNSLATLYGLALDCIERKVLDEDVEIRLSAYDETSTRIKPRAIAKTINTSGAMGLVGLVGVQTNQYPRALDLARQFRAEGIAVVIGGFHVSGCLAMLPGVQRDLQGAIDIGVTLFAGEAEGRLEQVIRDAYYGRMPPIYNFLHDLPDVQGAPTPFLPPELLTRYAFKETTFDAGRGCPFSCTFCTIINVQGRKSRRRSPDDIERLVRKNFEHGRRHYFITDDNFARNRDWEAILDRLIKLREVDGIPLRLIMQVDTMCHKLPGFIEKAARAGVTKVFVGLESIDPKSLDSAGKKQNRIAEYRRMLLEWRKAGVVTYAGYILGFPNDTMETILRDIKIIQKELPVDLIDFNQLTPLPGSEDHRRLFEQHVWMDPDMNKYDLNHVTMDHPKMTRQEWGEVYRLAWKRYYSTEHIETMLYRARASGVPMRRIAAMAFHFSACFEVEGVHGIEGGFFRRKYRLDRRPGLPRENPMIFYPRYAWEILSKHVRFSLLYWKYRRLARRVENDPKGDQYQDTALTPGELSEYSFRLRTPLTAGKT